MKTINAHQIPFLLDRNTSNDQVIKIFVDYNDIMFVEFEDGEEITFQATPAQLDWFNNLPEPKNPDENKPGCPGCIFCGPSTDPAYYEHDRLYRMRQAETAPQNAREAEAALVEMAAAKAPVGYAPCCYYPNPGYDQDDRPTGFCENCGGII